MAQDLKTQITDILLSALEKLDADQSQGTMGSASPSSVSQRPTETNIAPSFKRPTVARPCKHLDSGSSSSTTAAELNRMLCSGKLGKRPKIQKGGYRSTNIKKTVVESLICVFERS